MPSSVDFHFQSSLRGSSAAGGNNKTSAVKLHRGCSGALHGHGVDKVKSKVTPPPISCQRSCQTTTATTTSPIRQQQYDNESSESIHRRKKSMLGLGQVLHHQGVESKGLPPRSPPKFLTYSTRSLSSSTCSSSSSSRYSPSPGIYDNSPLHWPSSATAAYLEEVSEEDDSLIGCDQWTTTSDRMTCSTSSPIDQGRRQQQLLSPKQHGLVSPPRHHSTPNNSKPYTERNRPLENLTVKRSSNGSSYKSPTTATTSITTTTRDNKLNASGANKRVTDLKNNNPSKPTATTTTRLSRLSSPRSSISSQKSDKSTTSSSSTTRSNNSSCTTTSSRNISNNNGRVNKKPIASNSANNKKPIVANVTQSEVSQSLFFCF